MKRTLGVMTAIALIFVSCAAAFAAAPIKIGYLAALTGDFAAYGQAEVNMAKMVVGDINAAGGVLGRQLELVIYDTKTRNEDAMNAVRRMVENDKVVAIIGANTSGINIATARIVDRGRVAQIATCATNPLVTVTPQGEVRPYSFRICFTDPYQGTLAAELAMTTLGKDKAAILYNVGSDYAHGLCASSSSRYTARSAAK